MVAISGNTGAIGFTTTDYHVSNTVNPDWNANRGYFEIINLITGQKTSSLTSANLVPTLNNPSDGTTRILQGYAYNVALDGDLLLVGASFYDAHHEGYEFPVGKAFVYRFYPGPNNWVLEASLMDPPGGTPTTCLIKNIATPPPVALSNQTAVIGCAESGEYNDEGEYGAAFVYVVSETDVDGYTVGTWNQEAELSEGLALGDCFAEDAVAIDGDSILVSASGRLSQFGPGPGQPYAFHRSGGTWESKGALFPVEPLPNVDGFTLNFGGSLVIDGDTALVSSSNEGYNTVHVYAKDTQGNWMPNTTIIGPLGSNSASFLGSIGFFYIGIVVLASFAVM